MARIVYLLLAFLALLPRRLLQLMGGLLGALNYFFDTRATKVTRVNLGLCFPEMDTAGREKLVRESLAATGQTLLETPAVWLGPTSVMDSWVVEVHGEACLREGLESGKGVIVLLPHAGNWELFNVCFLRWGRMTALYQPPKKKAFRGLMETIRKRHGNKMVATNRSGLRELYRALKRGEAVVVLPDQVPEAGHYASFFGVAALTDPLVPRLASTGARVVAAAMIRRRDGRFALHLAPVSELGSAGGLPAALESVNRQVEWSVALAPAQYQWEYKRFRERPRGEPKAYRFGKPPEHHH